MKKDGTRPTVALALSGGASRGYAHIGVLKALEEANVPIDAIAGCSAGGMIGGLYAAGYSASDLEDELRKLISVRGIIKSVVPKRDSGSFFGQLSFDSRFRDNLSNFLAADLTFADLKIPFAVNVVCLTHGKEEILDSGGVAEAIRATVSVPGMFSSVAIGDHRYVDGGVLNNVPTNVARQLGGDVIVAVNVGNLMRSSMSSRSSRFRPRVADDMMQSVGIMLSTLSQTALELSPPDVTIRPNLPTHPTPIMDMIGMRKVIEAGYTAARQAIPQIEAQLAEAAIG